MKELIISLVATIIGLFGYGWFQKSKRNTAEAQNSNFDEKKDLLELDKQKQVDDGEAEREKIKHAYKSARQATKEADAKTIIDYLNKFLNK